MRNFVKATSLMLLASASALAWAQDSSQTIQIVAFREPPLGTLTPGQIFGPGLIDNMTKPEGVLPKEISASIQFATALRQELIAKGFLLSDVPSEVRPQKRNRPLAASTPNTLEVFTDYQAIQYLPFNWDKYQYGLKSRARLISADGSEAWEKNCYIKPTKKDERFQISKEAFAGDALRVQQVVQAAAAECANQVARQI